MVGYEGVNKQKIHNLKTKKINISAFIYFNQSFSYYNTGHKITDKNDNGMRLSDVLNKADNEDLVKLWVENKL